MKRWEEYRVWSDEEVGGVQGECDECNSVANTCNYLMKSGRGIIGAWGRGIIRCLGEEDLTS